MLPITSFLCPLLLYQPIILLAISGAVMADQRVINGTDVNPPHKYPWIVSLYAAGRQSDGSFVKIPQHVCGGSVLNEYYVLTAAHCCHQDLSTQNITAAGLLFVLTGLHERHELKPWSQNLSVAECIVHEHYEIQAGLLHDIALIRVNGKILFNDKVTPLNLPPYDFDVDTDGQVTAILMGWGLIGNVNQVKQEDLNPKVLQQTELPVITTETCQRRHGFSVIGQGNYSLPVPDTVLCTGFLEGGTGGCSFDSGSPVVVLNATTKTYTQVGIVSWGLMPCATTYTVNVRVPAYTRWIQSKLQKCYPRPLSGSSKFERSMLF